MLFFGMYLKCILLKLVVAVVAETVCATFVVSRRQKQGLMYLGGECRTVEEDADELCGFWLRDLAVKCGGYDKSRIKNVLYLVPGLGFEDGLRVVYHDHEVREMVEYALKNRSIQLYVVHGDGDDEVDVLKASHITKAVVGRPKKLTPKRAPQPAIRRSPRHKESATSESTNPAEVDPIPIQINVESCHPFSVINPTILQPQPRTPQRKNPAQETLSLEPPHNIQSPSPVPSHTLPSPEPPQKSPSPEFHRSAIPEDYQWEDNREHSPIPWQDLLWSEVQSDEDLTDPEYEPSYEIEDEEDVSVDVLGEEEEHNGNDDEDVEQQLEQEVLPYGEDDSSDDEVHIARQRVKGFTDNLVLLSHKLQKDASEGKLGAQQKGQPAIIVQEHNEEQRDGFDFAESEEDMHTPEDTDEEDSVQVRRLKRSLLVDTETDFTVFKWKVGQRFPTRELFREAVAKFAVFQGRNLSIVVSNHSRQQRLGVKCTEGCPFKLYAS
ncbi:Neurogenic locus notch-like protein 1 [Bienertia sinuspersici]